MASTYSPLLRFELIASGEQAGLWGNTTNSNLGTLVEQAVAGITTVNLTTTSDYTLSTLSGAADEARAATLIFTGAPGGTARVVIPALQKTYHVRNATNATLQFKTASQVGGVSVAAGGATVMHCDGVNAYSSVEKLYYTQMNFLSQNGGALSVPQYDSNGVLGLNATPAGTWNSSGGSYSVPTNLSGFAAIKPVGAFETTGGSFYYGSSAAPGAHLGTVVNAMWTGGGSGSFKYIRTNTPASIYMHGDSLFWWGYAAGSATSGAAANFAMSAYLDASNGNMVTRFNLGISDKRVKTDLKPITDAMAKVRQLVGYTFNMEGAPHRMPGLLAQDVQQVLPEAVITTPDGMMALAYGHLAGLFVNALNELDARITALEARCG